MDLGSTGTQFTWVHNRKGYNRTMQRIDRDLASSNWLSLFPKAMITNLLNYFSDHNTIILHCLSLRKRFRTRRFRFIAALLRNVDFEIQSQQLNVRLSTFAKQLTT